MIPFAAQIPLNGMLIESEEAMMTAGTAQVIGPADGKQVALGAIGARFMIDGEASGGGFSLVEHPMLRALGARRTGTIHEDEYSFVLGGAWARSRR
jgi:hypothetical protein